MIDRIVARVNDDVITLSELQEEGHPLFERLRANYTGKELESRSNVPSVSSLIS